MNQLACVALLILGATSSQGKERQDVRRRKVVDVIDRDSRDLMFLSERDKRVPIEERHDHDPIEKDVRSNIFNFTPAPTGTDTPAPTPTPTSAPIGITNAPIDVTTVAPVELPTAAPITQTSAPTGSGPGTQAPTGAPSGAGVPVESAVPSQQPSPGTIAPTPVDSGTGTLSPTASPVDGGTVAPTGSSEPTQAPTTFTQAPSLSSQPTLGPTEKLTLESFLFQTLTDDGTLTAQDTPQNLALLRLEETNPDLDPNVLADQVEITQKYALNVLYYTTEGESWVNSTDWTTASPTCDWFGIECDATDRIRVVDVNLAENDLVGLIPSEIRGLGDLGMYKFVSRVSRTEEGF
jgi:hypothetical protein